LKVFHITVCTELVVLRLNYLCESDPVFYTVEIILHEEAME